MLYSQCCECSTPRPPRQWVNVTLQCVESIRVGITVCCRKTTQLKVQNHLMYRLSGDFRPVTLLFSRQNVTMYFYELFSSRTEESQVPSPLASCSTSDTSTLQKRILFIQKPSRFFLSWLRVIILTVTTDESDAVETPHFL